MSWFRSVLARLFAWSSNSDRPGQVPANPEHVHTLARADALLADPRIRKLESNRQDAMRESFRRAGERLSGR